MPPDDATSSGNGSRKKHAPSLPRSPRVEIEQWTESVLILKKDAERELPNANAEIIHRNELSHPKQSPAAGHGESLGAAQDVQFSENGLDVALDGDFRDGQANADQLVRLAFRKQPQNIQFAWSQFFSG